MLAVGLRQTIHQGESRCLETLVQGYLVGAVHIAGTGATRLGVIGIGAQKGDFTSGLKRECAVVMKQHHTFESDAA